MQLFMFYDVVIIGLFWLWWKKNIFVVKEQPECLIFWEYGKKDITC
jgi:hypothetical protein